MNNIDFRLLKDRISVAYHSCWDKYPKDDKPIDSALKIFKKIKELERYNGGFKVDYQNELREAKLDLVEIFGMTYDELKKIRKNNLYLTHQSKMVNAIYIMNNEGGKI